MPQKPKRIGPALSDDLVPALLLLPLLAVLPLVAVSLTIALVLNVPGHAQELVLTVALLVDTALVLGVPGTVAFRTWRKGYRFLPVIAGLAPLVLPVLFCSGALR
ncbi:hypothetical protein ACGF12_04715 [Kitasatospora sp. NPDC048296]|uniref:hypothetical protein n=1 Tax=Kitasatospora sp. NPDC048296 TaxID=3364048 RepID=UPI00371BC383